jgi:RNA polymerase sigma-70 factor (ECF subfamily)
LRPSFNPIQGNRVKFEHAVLVHQCAAFNLARWLIGNDSDAQDVTQDAFVRAFQAWPAFRGGDARAWLLRIVRNCSYTWMTSHRSRDSVSLDEAAGDLASPDTGPEQALAIKFDAQRLSAAIESLPTEYREAVVLREMEGLSYKEISEIADVPIGTVMSRLSRARARLLCLLTECREEADSK